MVDQRKEAFVGIPFDSKEMKKLLFDFAQKVHTQAQKIIDGSFETNRGIWSIRGVLRFFDQAEKRVKGEIQKYEKTITGWNEEVKAGWEKLIAKMKPEEKVKTD